MGSPSYAKGAAMLCDRPAFRDFLTSMTGRAVGDANAAAKEVRLACDVLSRRELNTSPQAAEKYRALVARFNSWLSSCPATT